MRKLLIFLGFCRRPPTKIKNAHEKDAKRVDELIQHAIGPILKEVSENERKRINKLLRLDREMFP
jgi:hypothetical protein